MSAALKLARAEREEAAIERARRLGRLDVAERIEALVDAGSFVELGARRRHPSAPDERPDGDGIVCGVATVDGRRVVVIAHDPRQSRGSIGCVGADKTCDALARARTIGAPVVMLCDSEGARVHEGVETVVATQRMLGEFARTSGVVPMLCATLGLAGGAAGYAAALCDLVVAVEGRSFTFITGPQVIRTVTREEPTLADIGGSKMHASVTGLLHAVAADERAAIAWIKRALSYLPSSASSLPSSIDTRAPSDPSLANVVPESPRKAYDVKRAIVRLFDEASFFELGADFGKNLVTGFARLDGAVVGVVASQPAHLGGVLDVTASVKGARFVRMCTAFNVPIITLVDSPGFLPGVKQETGGLLLHGAKLLSAYTEASVPKISFILRKSCGAASVLNLDADVVLALPTVRVQTMGVDALMTVAWGSDLSLMDEETRESETRALADIHEDPFAAAEAGYVHRVVDPASAREELVRALACAPRPQPAPPGMRKLANLPL